MPEMHLRQPARGALHAGFTYSACGPFTKNKERIQRFKETGDTSYIYKNELDKACFQHDMAYRDFKDLARTTASEKHLILQKILNMMGIKKDWLLWFINFLIKSPQVVVVLRPLLHLLLIMVLNKTYN